MQFLQRRKAGSHSQWIATQRTGLIDRTHRRKAIHNFCPPAEGPHRQATADNFSKATQVRRDAKDLLRPAQAQAEPSHDFVEDKQRSAVSRDLPQKFQVAGPGQINSGVAWHRLQNDARNLPGVCSKGGFDHLRVIEGQDNCVLRKRCRHPLAVGIAKCERARSGLH